MLPDSKIIVTGLPRSGTSMMMQTLVAGGLSPCSDGQRAADENNPQGYLEHERVKGLAKDAQWLLDAEGQVVKVVAPLLRWLPDELACRVVWIERSLDEVIASQQKMIARAGAQGANLAPDRLKAALAQQAQSARDWMDRRPDTPVLTLQHRGVVEHPTRAAEQLCEFLGLEADPESMAAAVRPDLYRNRG